MILNIEMLTFIKVTESFSRSYQIVTIKEQDYYWNYYHCSNFHFQIAIYL